MRALFFSLLIILFTATAQAQLYFPDGKVKKLVTDESDIYFETMIPFICENGIRVIDMKWKYIYDSLPASWAVMGCMNGECLIGLPEEGKFTNILENPDGSGFFAYHFLMDTPGRGIIQYAIFKDSINEPHAAIVTIDVSYGMTSSISADLSGNKNIKLYPNPSDGDVYLEIPSSSIITIYDMQGRVVFSTDKMEAGNHLLPQLHKGAFIAEVVEVSTRTVVREKLIITR